jgi:hypothetical protein
MKYKSLDDLRFAVEYSIRYCELVERFYRKAGKLLTVLELFFGAGTVVTAVAEKSTASLVLGLSTAAVMALIHGWRPADTADKKRLQAKEYYGLRNQLAEDKLTELNRQYSDICADAADEIESLRWVALLDTCKLMGRSSDHYTLTRWQRLIASCV